jgi:uncharacterized protein YceH (UPF0502 family)
MEPDAVELRILGCLIEKQRTTPDAYPLSLNALRLACNQSTNRDPVVDYDEATIRDALNRLYRRRWTRLASGQGSRAAKYRHLLKEELRLDDAELALLAVLLLRGPQTPGELNQRAARLHPFAGLPAIEETLERLIGRGMAERLPRRPGQKEERYAQRMGEAGDPASATAAEPAPAHAPSPVAAPSTSPAVDRAVESVERRNADDRSLGTLGGREAGDPRLAALEVEVLELGAEVVREVRAAVEHAAAGLRADVEREVAALRAEVAALRAELGG